MGLILSAVSALGSTISDQWKEYFYCDALPSNVICQRGYKNNSGVANLGSDDVITDGSVIAVADGQCMLIVEQGQVVVLKSDSSIKGAVISVIDDPSEIRYQIFTNSLGVQVYYESQLMADEVQEIEE